MPKRKRPKISGEPVEPTYAWVPVYRHEGRWWMMLEVVESTRKGCIRAYERLNEADLLRRHGYPDGAEVKFLRVIVLPAFNQVEEG